MPNQPKAVCVRACVKSYEMIRDLVLTGDVLDVLDGLDVLDVLMVDDSLASAERHTAIPPHRHACGLSISPTTASQLRL